MINLIHGNAYNVLKENLNDEDSIFIFPDFIIIRNFQNSLAKDGVDKIPIERMFTLESLALNIIGPNSSTIPRFVERKIAEESLKGLSYYSDLHGNPDFITILLEEYWEIKESVLAQGIKIDDKFFLEFDRNFSNYLEKLRYGIKIDNKIVHFYSRPELIMKMIEKHDKINYRKIFLTNFYYISPTLKLFIETLRKDHEIYFLTEVGTGKPYEILRERIEPDCEYGEDVKKSSITVVSAPDKRREMKYVAKVILDGISNGDDFGDFIVAFPDIKEYESMVEEVFSEFEIPYFLESRQKLSRLPVISEAIEIAENIVKEKEIKDIESFVSILVEIIEDLMKKNIEKDEYIKHSHRIWEFIMSFKNDYEILQSLGIIPFSNELALKHFKIYSTISTFGRYFGFRNVVKVIDLGNLPLNTAKTIIVSGVSEDEFPRPYKGPIIFRKDIREKSGVYYRKYVIHENYEFYRLLITINYGENIIFTYSYFNDDGKRVLESYLIEKFMDIFKVERKNVTIEASELTVMKEKIFRDSEIFEYNGSVMKKEIEINDEIKDRINRMALTPSDLNLYKECPMKFYYRLILGISVPVEPFSPQDLGNRIHRILERFYSKYTDLNEIKNLDIKDEVEKIALNEYPELEENAIYRRTIVRDVVNAIKRDISILPDRKVKYVEMEFTLNLKGNILHGRIDRVDSWKDLTFIIDYKYSSFSSIQDIFIKKGNVNDPKFDLALPIYMMAIKENKKIAYYFPIKLKKKDQKWILAYVTGGEYKATPFSDYVKNNSQLFSNDFRERVEKKIIEIINQIKSYNFAKTDDERNCDECEFYYICGGV